jgi:CBS domain-containing protein
MIKISRPESPDMTSEFETPVRDVMTDPVRTVEGDASVRAVAGIMIGEAIGSVVVTTPTGIVTKTDVVTAVHRDVDLDGTAVSEVMTTEVVTVAPDDDLQTVVDRMASHGIKRLVVEADSEFVGIVTVTDLAGAFAIDLDSVIGMFV